MIVHITRAFLVIHNSHSSNIPYFLICSANLLNVSGSDGCLSGWEWLTGAVQAHV